MPVIRGSLDAARLRRAALFGFLASCFGGGCAVMTGAGFIFLLPGIVLGMIAGLIPFETEKMAYVLLVSVMFNFFVYMGCFYCASLIRTRVRSDNA